MKIILFYCFILCKIHSFVVDKKSIILNNPVSKINVEKSFKTKIPDIVNPIINSINGIL